MLQWRTLLDLWKTTFVMRLYRGLQFFRCHLPFIIGHRVTRIPTHEWWPIRLTRSFSCNTEFLVDGCITVTLNCRVFRVYFLKSCSRNVNFQRYIVAVVYDTTSNMNKFGTLLENWISCTYTARIMCYSSRPRILTLPVGTIGQFLELQIMQRISIWMKSWNCTLW